MTILVGIELFLRALNDDDDDDDTSGGNRIRAIQMQPLPVPSGT